MKIKKELKLLSIFLAICAITLYLPNNIVTASAEQAQEPDSTEEETLYVDTEESETDTGITSGDLIQIPSDDGDSSEIQVGNHFSYHYYPPESGGTHIIQDGVYAFENVGNDGLWMDIQQDKYLPGYHMQQYAATGIPAQTFDRSCLFKITRRAETDSYIIRSMLNNRLTFYFSGNEVLTKEIPPDDDDVSVNDTFKLVYNVAQNCFVIKPYSSSNVVAANNTTASGMAGAPNSYLKKSTESTSGDQARWYMYQYTGETHSGVVTHKSISTTNGIEIGTTVSITFKTWTTEIGKNTPYLTVNPDYTDMVTATWDASTYTLTVTPTKVGTFKLRGIIRSDGTTTAFRTYALTYYAIPKIDGKTSFIQNVGTERYVDIEGPSKAAEAIIQQWQFNGKPQSKWLFEVQSAGYFSIKSPYSNKYIGVDSTATTVIRQYDTSSDYTLWRFVETTSGNYKLICKATESSGNVLSVPLNANSNGTNLTMIPYTDDTNYRDEWALYIINYSATVNNFYDNGYCVRYGETSTESAATIKEYNRVVAERYAQLLGLSVTINNVQYFQSAIDSCKQIVTSANIDTMCSHDGTDHTNRASLRSDFSSSHSGNQTTTCVLWTCHKIASIATNGTTDYNRSCSSGTCVYMLEICSATNRLKNSQGVLMHELNHQYGAKDHYHELTDSSDPNSCKFKETCSDCGINPRSKSCVMYRSRVDINAATIICDECKDDIIEHLNSHH